MPPFGGLWPIWTALRPQWMPWPMPWPPRARGDARAGCVRYAKLANSPCTKTKPGRFCGNSFKCHHSVGCGRSGWPCGRSGCPGRCHGRPGCVGMPGPAAWGVRSWLIHRALKPNTAGFVENSTQNLVRLPQGTTSCHVVPSVSRDTSSLVLHLGKEAHGHGNSASVCKCVYSAP